MKTLCWVVAMFAGAALLTSCEQDENMVVKGEFNRVIESCDDTAFTTCHEWIHFDGDGQATFVPSGDIIFKGSYRISKSLVTVTNQNNGRVVYKFAIESKDVLVEQPSGERWERSR